MTNLMTQVHNLMPEFTIAGCAIINRQLIPVASIVLTYVHNFLNFNHTVLLNS